MPIAIAAVTVLLQACFIYHVFKTGRDARWAFLILMAPIIGCIVYYFASSSKRNRTPARSRAKRYGPNWRGTN